MLCTRCAAFVGSWMTHQTTNATASHFRIVPSFTAASLEAQTAPSCRFLNLRPKRDLDGLGHPGRYGGGHARPAASMPATRGRYACALGENVPTRDAVCP